MNERSNNNSTERSNLPLNYSVNNPPTKQKKCFFRYIDAFMKIGIAITGLSISWIGHEYQQTAKTSELLVAQENGDTQIRALMFGKITERLLQPVKNTDSTVQDAILTQVLTLNFHELLDIRPIIIDLHNKLEKKIDNESLSIGEREKAKTAREGLVSVTKRIRDRQVTALIKNNSWNNIHREDKKDGDVYHFSILKAGSKRTKHNNACFVPSNDSNIIDEKEINVCEGELVVLPGPVAKKSIFLTVLEVNWKKHEVMVRIRIGDKNPPIKGKPLKITKDESTCRKISDRSIPEPPMPGSKEFTVSWFDLPYTENVLMANDSRHALYIDEVCEDEKEEEYAVRLALLYFPEDYYPGRERPVRYTQLRDRLNMK